MIIFLRTIFYQFFILFIGLSLGFILNAEYIGYKSVLLSRSFCNIFDPIEYDSDLLKDLKSWGSYKVWSMRGEPESFEVLEEAILAEEWYWVKFSYMDGGEKRVDIESVRIRWKTWEYYYDSTVPTEAELREYMERGNLNSDESDRALRLRDEKILMMRKGT